MATKRTWTIGAYEDELGRVVVDQDGLVTLLSDLAGTLRSVGGMFSVAAEREEVSPGSDEGMTVGYRLMWQPFVPMTRTQPPAEPDPMPHEEPDELRVAPNPEPEPVEA